MKTRKQIPLFGFILLFCLVIICWTISDAGGWATIDPPMPTTAQAATPKKEPKLEITIPPLLNGRTSATVLKVKLTEPDSGELRYTINGQETKTAELRSTDAATSEISLQEGVNYINLDFIPPNDSAYAAWQKSMKVTVDTTAPVAQYAELVELPTRGPVLMITFVESDLDRRTSINVFELRRQEDSGGFTQSLALTGAPEIVDRTIRLPAVNWPAGVYELTIKTELSDDLGNKSKDNAVQKLNFIVSGERKFGTHVEFPPYAPPKKQDVPTEGFNPDDYVETRVARLYYYRDAHRVAEIINRNVRSYNQAAVTLAERSAEKARESFEDKVDARRKAERQAIQSAQQARAAENQLKSARETQQAGINITKTLEFFTARKTEIEGLLAPVNAAMKTASDDRDKSAQAKYEFDAQTTAANDAEANAVAAETTNKSNDNETTRKIAIDSRAFAQRKKLELEQLKERKLDAIAAAEKSRKTAEDLAKESKSDTLLQELKRINAEIKRLEEQQLLVGSKSTLPDTIANLEKSVADLRRTELLETEKSMEAMAAEDRAAKTRFRAEVTSAKTDPDTYVAGDIKSPDPVTQVSISVIGEGLIQLRGPIKGINKIRTMINEIDSPVGQIKIGIYSMQINGEKGETLEKAIGDSEGYVDLARFLVNQSLENLRRAIQSEASEIAAACEMEGHYQVDRDRRYLYSFFGRDFVDELYEMNSEFLNSENKLLSLHAMDTVGLNRSLFILALAKNDVRERILARFLETCPYELADAEFDFRRSSELKPHRTEKSFPAWNRTHLPLLNHHKKEQLIYEAVQRNALQRYHFRNVRSFFDVGISHADTMNPMQREFIRLAQIFKARLIAEMELKQRVIERGLIEDRSSSDEHRYTKLQPIHLQAIDLEAEVQRKRVEAFGKRTDTSKWVDETLASVRDKISEFTERANESTDDNDLTSLIKIGETLVNQQWVTDRFRKSIAVELERARDLNTQLEKSALNQSGQEVNVRNRVKCFLKDLGNELEAIYHPPTTDPNDSLKLSNQIRLFTTIWNKFGREYSEFRAMLEREDVNMQDVLAKKNQLMETLGHIRDSRSYSEITSRIDDMVRSAQDDSAFTHRLDLARKLARDTRTDLDHRKLLNHLIDEQEDKFIELVEGSRSHIAVMDQYLKRLSIALEDDFKVQFYDPAFVRAREAARARQVTLSQIERTTVLTNNRAFAKVDPQATMEFDLPKRQIAIKEAFDAAKALVEDTGALIKDPTFLSAFQMMGGGPAATTVKSPLPGQSMTANQQDIGHIPPNQTVATPGSSLQSLVPEPSVFKLETGTGFQLRPVMQPDGDSVVYDFDYMYTTQIHEPVRADEKHIGRVKRHFVHTEVQTSNYEMREISRYSVALKVARTSRGVPLLEDVPIVGAAFRPAPSTESSIQQNIIFGQTSVYPTLFDLMGLRWAPQVADLDHARLQEQEHVIRGRQKSIRDFVFNQASTRVDDFLDIKTKYPPAHRPDLYHSQSHTSPHHPNGYSYREAAEDPTGENYEKPDMRPQDMQDPPYDRYRRRPVKPESIGPQYQPSQPAPEEIPLSPPTPVTSATRQSSYYVPQRGVNSNKPQSVETAPVKRINAGDPQVSSRRVTTNYPARVETSAGGTNNRGTRGGKDVIPVTYDEEEPKTFSTNLKRLWTGR